MRYFVKWSQLITMGLTFNGCSEGCVGRTVEINLAFSLGEEQTGGVIPHLFYLTLKNE